jgi:hypothetical protein
MASGASKSSNQCSHFENFLKARASSFRDVQAGSLPSFPNVAPAVQRVVKVSSQVPDVSVLEVLQTARAGGFITFV